MDKALIEAAVVVTRALCLGIQVRANGLVYELAEDGEILVVRSNETTGEPHYMRIFADYARLGALDIARRLSEHEIAVLNADVMVAEYETEVHK